MITINKIGEDYNDELLHFVGLSTDEKPLEKFKNVFITNGSTYKEMDTGALYYYDVESHNWV